MTPLRILLVDEYAILREGLRHILAEIPEFSVVGEAADTVSALEQVWRLQPDVVVLDIALPGMNGLDLTARLRQSHPQTQVVILTGKSHEEYVLKALDAGATGFVHKRAESHMLIAAIRAAGRHEHYLCPMIRDDVIRQFLLERRHGPANGHYDALSVREQQVLRLLAEGHATRKVAELLNISPKTVEKHRVNLMHKLGLPNLVALVKYAVSLELVGVEPTRQEFPTQRMRTSLPKK